VIVTESFLLAVGQPHALAGLHGVYPKAQLTLPGYVICDPNMGSFLEFRPFSASFSSLTVEITSSQRKMDRGEP
jgi:hypothetical protein